MKSVKAYVAAMRFIVKVGAAVGAGGFWGMAFALVLMKLLDISGDDAMLYGGMPATMLFIAFIWPKLPKIFGFTR